jgi:glucose/arabinose dehydrogenase
LRCCLIAAIVVGAIAGVASIDRAQAASAPAVLSGPAALGDWSADATGFVASDAEVWGRPVGVAVAHDGSLIVTEDAYGTVWRISYRGKTSPQR